MSGLDMMLKSMLGIDPAELKAQFEGGMKTLGETLQHFDRRLAAIEERQRLTNSILEKFFNGLPPPTTQATENEHDGRNDALDGRTDIIDGKLVGGDAGSSGHSTAG